MLILEVCCLFGHQNLENINQSYLLKLRKYDATPAKLTNFGRQSFPFSSVDYHPNIFGSRGFVPTQIETPHRCVQRQCKRRRPGDDCCARMCERSTCGVPGNHGCKHHTRTWRSNTDREHHQQTYPSGACYQPVPHTPSTPTLLSRLSLGR